MPLRFYNPVKDLCVKVNLDYETVIGTGLSSAMRSAYVNADIQKPLEQIKTDDKKRVKHKIEFLNRKYGGDSKTGTGEGEVEDKGRIRYDAGVTVNTILPDSGEVDESQTLRNELVSSESKPFAYKRTDMLWCPGKGLVRRCDIGRPETS